MKDRRRRGFGSWLTKKSRQEYKGRWQQESLAKEYLKQVKCCHDTDCNEPMMKKGFTALKNGTWEEFKETFKKKMKASEWGLRQDKRGVRLGSKGRGRKDEHCARDHAQKHTLFSANQCVSWMTRRSHNVKLVPELQQFPSGRLRVVGLGGKSHKVVVCNLWSKVRLEANE